MSDKIADLNSDTFENAVNTELPVLVDFWAQWCGPCKAITPILEELAGELDGKLKIAKVDVDQNQELAGKYQVTSIPTLLLFKGGEVSERIVGLRSKDDLKKLVGS